MLLLSLFHSKIFTLVLCILSYRYYLRFFDNYVTEKFLGERGFGFVVEAVLKKNAAAKEVLAMAQFKHKNTVGYKSAWKEKLPKEYLKNLFSDQSDITEESTQNRKSIDSMNSIQSIQINNGRNYQSQSLNNSVQFKYSTNDSNTETDQTNTKSGTSDATESSFISDEEDSSNELEKHVLIIIMELCTQETLAQRLRSEDSQYPIGRVEGLRIFYEIVQGIKYIHEKNIIHRDLKPPNIYFSSSDDKTIKIGDFGLVREENLNSSDIHNDEIDQSYHIYAMGIILFELLCKFGNEMERNNALEDIREVKIRFSDDMNKKLGTNSLKYQNLICRLLQQEPNDRPDTRTLENNMKNDIDSIDYRRLTSNNQYEEESADPTATTQTIERILNNLSEYEIPLETDEIQYEHMAVCFEYDLILLYENSTLKPYDNINKLDEQIWDGFLWGPNKRSLYYNYIDEIRLITCSQNGEHLAMNVFLNQQKWVIDYRQTDFNLTHLKRTEAPIEYFPFRKLDLFSLVKEENSEKYSEWLVIDEKNSFYTIGISQQRIYKKSIQTNGIRNYLFHTKPHLYFHWFYHQHFLIMSTPCDDKKGK
ncbi:hypothetical protein I4U23_010492 [Adineta vaga]|nr:hypothetical protein I4U23_010492 [Adineta vaga]